MIRIARLDLARWGHFDDRQLLFGPAGRLHVLFGGNEAGKSTTRRAVGALLFGVPERTTDTFGRPGSDLRVGALLELDGVPTEVVRRKGRKQTLLDAEGAPLDPAAFDAALGGLSGEVHAGLFEVTHDSLVEGGHELLAGRGAVGESLFAAAAGTSRLHALLARLEEEADAIFTPLGRKKDLNLLLARHADALRRGREAALRPQGYEQRVRDLEALQDAYARAGTALEETERERTRLERLRGALPLAALRATRAAELEALGEVPALAADATARRVAALARRDEARARAAAADRDLRRRRERHAELAVDEALLPFADELVALHAHGSAVAAEATRREEQVAARAGLAPRLAALLPTLAPALGDRTLEDLALDADSRGRLEACLQARAGVQQAAGAARDALADARRAAERALAAADAAGTPVDAEGLAATVRAARQAGAVDQLVAASRAEERAALAQAERAAVALHPAPADAAVLATLPVPDGETVARLLGDLVEAERVAGELETEAEAIGERVRRLERQRDDLGAEAAVLDAAALPEARRVREQRWSAVRAALVAPVPADAAAHVAEEFERAVAGADAIADARLQRAEDVARLAGVERELHKLAGDAEELVARRERHATVQTRAAAAWDEAWAPAAALAPSPAAAGAWLAARDEVLRYLDDAATARERAQVAEALRAEHAGALREALAVAGAAAPDGELPLATLVELADARLETLREAADRTGRAAAEAQRTAAEVEDAEHAVERAEQRLAGWEAEWSELRGGCGLAESLSPQDALAALRGLEEAARLQERVAEIDDEVAAIAARHAAFEDAVGGLIGAVAPDLAGQAATAAVAILHRRALDARAAAAERDALAAELAELEAEHAEALALAAEAEAELGALRAAAGAEDDAALARCEADSARAEALRTEIARLDGDLAQAGGAPADEVAAAVAALDADGAPARAEALDALAVERRAERDAAGEAVTRARDDLTRLERSEEAAQAAQEAATLEAQIRELAERYARARLAQRVLRDAIARYRSEHEGPLLARANELFPALTCERFARLETDVDERDEDVLVAVTSDGGRRRVEQLSDGTREQLFLALRLAAIERHVTTAQPVPVLFDDVLLESDDERAERIVAALAELAGRTQVILLTHHRHLVDIARATVPEDRLDVLALDAQADEATADVVVVQEAPPLHRELAAVVPAAPREPLFGEQGALL